MTRFISEWLIRSIPLTLWVLCFVAGAASAQESSEFVVQFDKSVFPENYSGRLYLFFSRGKKEPRFGPNWFGPEPFVSVDVDELTPGQQLSFSLHDENVLRFPKSLRIQNVMKHRVQAVVRFNPLDRNVGTGTGNGYSDSQVFQGETSVSLPITKRVAAKSPRLDPRSHVVKIKSQLLSDFHQRPVFVRGTVTVPVSYETRTDQKYPVIYEVPGFGGTHLTPQLLRRHVQPAGNSKGVEFIRVMLDPSCPWGHHVFANSDFNGPWGDALVQEFIPAIDEQFRTDARVCGRFVTGHSSGGWSSFWLQLNSPKTFGGTWSTAPDPLDFRDFQRINLYDKQENMFVDSNGKRRPLGRMNGRVLVWYDDFSHMEHVLGYGGQLASFEAVFSDLGENGLPQQLWNRETGEIDPEVAESWRDYDINLLLKNNWSTLKDDLQGKLHLYMGDQDNFYLEGATLLVQQTLKELNSDAYVEILPGKDHMNLFSDGLDRRIEESMATQYLQHRSE